VETVACGDLYERHADRLLRYCLFLLGGRREEAEDAVQITFLNALQALKRGVRPSAEAAWLKTIARNVCFSRREAIRRRQALETACDPQLLSDVAGVHDHEGEDAVCFREALARLPESQRQAILLREWQGLSYGEIADELGLTAAAVETLIFRARRTLADEIARIAGRKRRSRFASIFDLTSLFGAIKSGLSAWTAKAVAVAVLVSATTLTGAFVARDLRGNEMAHETRARATASHDGVEPSAAPFQRAAAVAPVARSTRARTELSASGWPLAPALAPAGARPHASSTPSGPGSAELGQEANVVSDAAAGSAGEAPAKTASSSKAARLARPSRTRKAAGRLVDGVTKLVPATVGEVEETADQLADVLADSLAGTTEVVDDTTAAVSGLVDETVPGAVTTIADTVANLPSLPAGPQPSAPTPPSSAPPPPSSGPGAVVDGLLAGH
jgi:RNA polymerase sigma factor (sigma-70 family)